MKANYVADRGNRFGVICHNAEITMNVELI